MRCGVALLAICGLGAGCGRLGFDSVSVVDGDIFDAHVLDGGVFGAPSLISELSSSSNDDDPTLTRDLLEIYFASERSGGAGLEDIWFSTRATVDDAWQPPAPADDLNTPEVETTPELASDGLTIFFASLRGGATNGDIYMSTRVSRADTWSVPVVVPELTTAMDEVSPSPNASLLRIVLHRDLGGGQSRDLFEFSRANVDDSWVPALPLATLNGPAREQDPHLASGDLVMLFASDRQSSALDLFLATRPGVDQPFEAPSALDELNSPSDDADPWLSADTRAIFFSSSRGGANDLYIATR